MIEKAGKIKSKIRRISSPRTKKAKTAEKEQQYTSLLVQLEALGDSLCDDSAVVWRKLDCSLGVYGGFSIQTWKRMVALLSKDEKLETFPTKVKLLRARCESGELLQQMRKKSTRKKEINAGDEDLVIADDQDLHDLLFSDDDDDDDI